MENSRRMRESARSLVCVALAASLLALSVAPDVEARQDRHDHHTQQTTRPTPTPTPQTSPSHQQQQQSPPHATDHTTRQTDHTTRQTDHTTHQTAPGRAPAREVEQSGPVVTLQELEALALKNNPTLAQADAIVRAAEGRRRQAGLFPNPVVGYFAEDLAFRAPGDTSEHGVFVEQTIPLGGKLGKAKRVFEREREQAEVLAEAQRLRVLNSVRLLYAEALGAQRLVELRRNLAALARDAVGITAELFNVGQADKPDQLEIEIEAERAEIESMKAENDYVQAWRALAAMVGAPEMEPARLAGSLEEPFPSMEEGQVLATLLRDSPEVRAARASVERARALVSRARAERVPDIFLRGGLGYSNELLERDGRKTGAKGHLEVGITLPIFNRNQGGISEAEAELAVAERELERLELQLRSRLASSMREYRNASRMVEKYRTGVVPRARAAYEMYLANFRQMAASYPQVLIAQRTLFQVEAEYARALVNLRQSAVGLRGFLLAGGLDAAARPGEGGGERTEGFMLRSPNEASDSDEQ